jgi:polyisoprenoid-binding protein YceI
MENTTLNPVAVLAPVKESYTIDNVHTNVAFTVRHLLISKVRGKFTAFQGTIDLDPADMTKTSIAGTIESASINTGDAARDAHLKSADFFDVEEFPEITFKSTKVEERRGGYLVHGDLTIRGITKPVVLQAELSGPITDPWGNKKIGVEARAKINRQDFNVSWNSVMDNGGVVVGDEVEIRIDAEGVTK